MRAYLELMRPANIVTALADILAGFATAGAVEVLGMRTGAELLPSLAWLLFSTAGLYGGGVVLNDYFDAELDASERPERPIPSGRVPRRNAGVVGGILLLIGIAAAAVVSVVSAGIAFAIALWVVSYDAYGKHHPILGPLNMGMCRGGNLLLGVSAVPAMIGRMWFLATLPLLYIAAVTAVSRGEVHGGRRRTGFVALVFVGLVIAGLLGLGVLPEYDVLRAVPFLLIFTIAVVPAFIQAALDPQAGHVRAAVKRGVLSLILMNATLAAGFGGWMIGLATIALLPVPILFAKAFAVT
jgi:hypothetical protein